MDELDRNIIQYLQQNGRQPFTDIAQKLEVSEGTIRKRVSRLIEEGFLRVIGVADPVKLGYKVSAVIGISIQGGQLDRIAQKIAEIPEISDVALVSGEFDLIALAYCYNREHLTTLISEKLRSIEGIAHTQTFVILKNFKTTNNLRPIDPSNYNQC